MSGCSDCHANLARPRILLHHMRAHAPTRTHTYPHAHSTQVLHEQKCKMYIIPRCVRACVCVCVRVCVRLRLRLRARARARVCVCVQDIHHTYTDTTRNTDRDPGTRPIHPTYPKQRPHPHTRTHHSIPETTPFVPQARKEISKIKFFKLDQLPKVRARACVRACVWQLCPRCQLGVEVARARVCVSVCVFLAAVPTLPAWG